VVVECWSPPAGWREVWRHQLRWARTIRVCMPGPYFASIVSNATLWPLLWALASLPAMTWRGLDAGSGVEVSVALTIPLAVIFAAVCLVTRIVTADDLQRRLSPMHPRLHDFWLVPVKDLLQAVLWVGAFAGNHIEWRGEKYRLRRDGTLEKK
jgi:ceramide glucosyltransferase